MPKNYWLPKEQRIKRAAAKQTKQIQDEITITDAATGEPLVGEPLTPHEQMVFHERIAAMWGGCDYCIAQPNDHAHREVCAEYQSALQQRIAIH